LIGTLEKKSAGTTTFLLVVGNDFVNPHTTTTTTTMMTTMTCMTTRMSIATTNHRRAGGRPVATMTMKMGNGGGKKMPIDADPTQRITMLMMPPTRRRCRSVTRAGASSGHHENTGGLNGHALNGRAVRVASASTKAPVGSALDAAQAFSNLVLDAKKLAAEDEENAAGRVDLGPRAGVVSSSVLLHAVRRGGRDAGAVEGAMALLNEDTATTYEGVVDKARANLAHMWAERVDGRVSVELGSELARDTDGLVRKARALLTLCDELKTPRSKLLFKIPATYEGVEAVRALEAEGIACHVSHVYCREQAYAAIGAGASVVQLYYSRSNAWYKQNPGAASAQSSGGDPAYDLIRDVFAFVKSSSQKTKVMVASLHNIQAVKRVLGVDYLLLGQRLIDELAETPANDLGETIISDSAGGAPLSEAKVSRAQFDAGCAASPAASELDIALKRNSAADASLLEFIKETRPAGNA
jgi:transaldolase